MLQAHAVFFLHKVLLSFPVSFGGIFRAYSSVEYPFRACACSDCREITMARIARDMATSVSNERFLRESLCAIFLARFSRDIWRARRIARMATSVSNERFFLHRIKGKPQSLRVAIHLKPIQLGAIKLFFSRKYTNTALSYLLV